MEKVKALELQGKVTTLPPKRNSQLGANILILQERYFYQRKVKPCGLRSQIY